MDFVLVLLLIFGVLPSGLSSRNSSFCHEMCPAGQHKAGECNNGQGVLCVDCENGKFISGANKRDFCFLCNYCQHHEKVTRPCTSTSDVECVCQDGYYKDKKDNSCMQCNCKHCKDPNIPTDYMRKCQPCQRADCLVDPECKERCTESSTRLPTPASTRTSPSNRTSNPSTRPPATTSTRTSPSNRTPNPSVITLSEDAGRHLPWLFLLVVVAICLLLSGLLWHFARKYPGTFNGRHCWGVKKEHHGNPTTLTFNFSEESPMMDLSHCPVSPQTPAAQVCPPLPIAELEAIRQEEQSELWPAIVLYAIIKEVPLRRWKEFLRLLSVADQQLERVELEASLGLSSMEKQYQMLRLWSQRSNTNLNDIFSALHYMDLSGCAQLLQESLDKLQWRPEPK